MLQRKRRSNKLGILHLIVILVIFLVSCSQVINTKVHSENRTETIVVNKTIFKKEVFNNKKDTLVGYWAQVKDTIYYIPSSVINNNCLIEPIPMACISMKTGTSYEYGGYICANYLSMKSLLREKRFTKSDTLLIFEHACNNIFSDELHDVQLKTIQETDSVLVLDFKNKTDKKRFSDAPSVLGDKRIFVFSLKKGLLTYKKLSTDSINHCLY